MFAATDFNTLTRFDWIMLYVGLLVIFAGGIVLLDRVNGGKTLFWGDTLTLDWRRLTPAMIMVNVGCTLIMFGVNSWSAVGIILANIGIVPFVVGALRWIRTLCAAGSIENSFPTMPFLGNVSIFLAGAGVIALGTFA